MGSISNNKEENTQHLFTQCPHAKFIWELEASLSDGGTLIYDNLQQVWEYVQKNKTKYNGELTIRVASCIWHI